MQKSTDENNKEERLNVLIADVERRSPEDIDRFGSIIRESDIFNDEYLTSNTESDNSMSDKVKDFCLRFKDLISTPKACGEEITVTKAKKVKSTQYGDVYSMTANPRGFCVIIDNHLFTVPFLQFRAGSRADSYRLKEVFSQLGFHVLYYANKTAREMEQLLQKIANDPQLVSHDALSVIILTHGVSDGLYGTDGITVLVEDILKIFNNANCQALIEKPKMFFLSACRGGNLQYISAVLYSLITLFR